MLCYINLFCVFYVFLHVLVIVSFYIVSFCFPVVVLVELPAFNCSNVLASLGAYKGE